MHIVAEERNKNNTNGKITMMIDKRERKENALAYSLLYKVKKMLLH